MCRLRRLVPRALGVRPSHAAATLVDRPYRDCIYKSSIICVVGSLIVVDCWCCGWLMKDCYDAGSRRLGGCRERITGRGDRLVACCGKLNAGKDGEVVGGENKREGRC